MKDRMMAAAHGFRCMSALGTAFLLVVSASWVSAVKGETPMQISRAELVRIAGYGEERLSSVLVVGTLNCEACVEPGSRHLRTSHVSGAKVAVACKTEGKRRRTNWAHGTTDEYGEFIVDLPSQLHAIPRLEEACVVRILRMPKNSFCRQRSSVRPRRIKLSSVGNSIRVYTAGIVRLRRKSGASNYDCSRVLMA